MPPDWAWHRFQSFDGTDIRWGETGNGRSARATLVYVPGYTNTLDGFGEQFDLWARRGFHVVGMDLRGQGGSGGNVGGDKLPRLRDGEVVPNARDIIGLLRSLPRVEEQPVVLVGSSYGGFMATLALLEDPDVADGFVAVAPAYTPRVEADPDTFRRATRVATALGLGEKYGPGQGPWRPFTLERGVQSWCAVDHPRMYTALGVHLRKPEQRVGGLSWGVMRDWAELSDALLAGELGELAVPTRMVFAGGDRVVENAPGRAWCAGMELCGSVTWKDATHCVLLERDELVERVADEVEGVISSLPD